MYAELCKTKTASASRLSPGLLLAHLDVRYVVDEVRRQVSVLDPSEKSI